MIPGVWGSDPEERWLQRPLNASSGHSAKQEQKRIETYAY
jgi:hypothetical protein